MAIQEQSMKPNNLAETLAKELKTPVVINTGHEDAGIRSIALPPGWTATQSDDEQYLPKPRRKRAHVIMDDLDSFTSYVKRHGSLNYCTVWCKTDYGRGTVGFTGIINDHGETEDAQNWRDHKAIFNPTFSEEWNRWTKNADKDMSQAEFAIFIENNLRDIASLEGLPTGAQMLEMALTFEANQDMRFKSAIRLQSGGVQMSFVQDDDAQTIEQMQVFDRFAIGIPVFWNSEPYRVDARLRYRIQGGKLTFWYELIRRDKVLEDATKTMVDKIKAQTGMPFFYGAPF